MKTKLAKKFDCVEMKRKGAEAVRRKLKGLSRRQELEYWNHRSEELGSKIKAARTKNK